SVTVTSAGTPLVLGPGQGLRMGPRGLERWQSDPALVGAWRDGRLVADAMAVGEVVDILRRHHHGVFVVTDDRLADRRVSGVYDLGDPQRLLRAVVRPFGASVRTLSPLVTMIG
ncbi:MAG: iron dicitrate transport regulator FecR, partial [Caenispirillum sp.]|nr:iron dicitrate transport regulator FecR [Caenispirillum sp.]